MKYIKLMLDIGPGGIIYPPAYHTTPLQGGGYITEKDSKKGSMILWGDDVSISNYIGHSAVTELTKEEAIAYSETHQERVLKVTDPVQLELIKIKALLGRPLTQEDENAIDPDNLTNGVIRAEIFADQISKLSIVEK